jgi:membrane protein DedA with SNARE-associated domain
MHSLIDLVRAHGSLVVLAASFLESAGLPLPAFAVLVLAGCLVAEGPVSLPLTLLGATVGALTADMAWFYFGRRRGRRTLYLFCKLSLNPDACVGRTERLFRSRSTATILASKLIPGLNALVPPLAGILRMPAWKYILLDTAASVIWAVLGVGLGIAFGVGVLSRLESMQRVLFWLLVLLSLGYVASRLLYRRYLVKHYTVPKIGSSELLERISSGNEVLVVDLRSEDAFLRSDVAVPGALRIRPAEFDRHIHRLPPEKEIVLYCT